MEKIKILLNQYKGMSEPVKASIWYTICNIFQKGISFIVIPIYTRVLTTAEYGNYMVFQSWRDIIIIFATLNLYCGVFTKAMVDYDDDRDQYTAAIQGLSTTITLVLLGVYLIGHNFWNSLFEMSTYTIFLLFVYYITYPAFTFWTVRQRVEYKYKRMVAFTLLSAVLTPIFSLLLLYNTNLRELSVIWGYLIVQITFGLAFYIYNFIKGRVFFVSYYWHRALKFNIPLIPHYLSLIVLGQADRIMIGEMCGTSKTAIYSLAYQVSMLMNVVIAAINNSLVPWIYDKLKSKCYNEICKKTKIISFFVLSMSICSILIAPEIVKILGTDEYIEAIWIIPAVSVSVYFTFCYGLFSDVEFYYSATKYVMIASTIGAVLNVLLNTLFIPRFGYIAAGYTTVVCYLTFMIMHYFFMRKVLEKEKNNARVFDVKFIIFSCLLICIISIGCMVLYKTFYLRYGIILCILIIILALKNKLLDFISKFKEDQL